MGDSIGVGIAPVTVFETTTMTIVPIYAAVRLLEPQAARIRVIVNGEVYTTVPVRGQ